MEIRSITLSITVQPTVRDKIKTFVKHGQMSDYIYQLVIDDLMTKGLLSRQDLEDMYYD